MQFSKVILAFCFIIMIVSLVESADYKEWIPLLPKEINGFKIEGEPQGVNMEFGGQRRSSLTQNYKKTSEGDDKIEIVIVNGKGAPQIAGYDDLKITL